MTTRKHLVQKREIASAAAAAKKTSTKNGLIAQPVVEATTPATSNAKLIRDSFTIPKTEYAVLDALKLRATSLMRPTKKGEVLRAGLFALNAMNDKSLLDALNRVPSLKTGRPKKLPTR